MALAGTVCAWGRGAKEALRVTLMERAWRECGVVEVVMGQGAAGE